MVLESLILHGAGVSDIAWCLRYDIYAFSAPAGILAKATYPAVRFLQKRFAADSVRKMKSILGEKE